MSTTPQIDAAVELARPVGHDSMPRIREYVPVEFARQLERENAALRAELLEEARVNGKGGEREAKLLAEVAALRKQLEQWNQSTEWFAEWVEKKQELEREKADLLESTKVFCTHIQTLADLLTPEQKLKAIDAIEAGRRGKP